MPDSLQKQVNKRLHSKRGGHSTDKQAELNASSLCPVRHSNCEVCGFCLGRYNNVISVAHMYLLFLLCMNLEIVRLLLELGHQVSGHQKF